VFNDNSNTVTIQNVTTTGVANLNSVGNIFISGGVAGYVLQTDGEGNLSWTIPTGNITSILDQQIFGDGSTLDFTLITPSVTNAVIVSLNGVLQIPSVAYTVLSDTITFTEAPLSTDLVDIRFLIFGASPDNYPGGADGFIQFNSSGAFGGAANLRYYANTGNLYSSNVSVSGNVTASYYYGDGSFLTGIVATANTGTITFANNVISTSNANAAINIIAPQQTGVSQATGGNSAVSQLLWATNISDLTPEQILNGVINSNTWGTQISVGNTGAVIGSNSALGLQTWTFGTNGIFSTAGGVTSGNINVLGEVAANTITASANITAQGNVSGTYILGNGSLLTGLPDAYGNANVANYLNGFIGDIVPVANISYSLGNSTRWWSNLWVANNTIYIGGVPLGMTTDNVLTVNGNAVLINNSNTSISTLGNITANYFVGNGSLLTGLPESYGNANVADYLLTYTGNVAVGNLLAAANVLATNGTFTTVVTARNINADGGNISLNPDNGLIFTQSNAVITANTESWTFDTGGDLTAPGNISTAGNVEASYVYGDSIEGNVITGGTANISGNITANLFFGDGSQLTGITVSANTGNLTFNNSTIVGPSFGVVPSANSSVFIQPTIDSNAVFQFTGTGNLVLPGNTFSVNYANGIPVSLGGGSAYGDSNVVTLMGVFGSNVISTTGNISAGNISTGNVVATRVQNDGNLEIRSNVAGTIRNWTFDSLGDFNTPPAGNISVGGRLSANRITAEGNISATGNVSGGNLISSATIFGNVDVVLGNTANASATKTRMVTDTTFSYIQTGNGTVGSTGNIVFSPYSSPTQRVVIDTAGGNLTAAGNVTAQNFIGNISITGNVIGTQPNVTLVAGAYDWTFDNTGNLTLPGNTFAVNYANNTPVDVVTRFEGTWTVPTGNSTQSFTVTPNNTYNMWVEGNIPNGIIVWNATATVTNTNVPVAGAQYAWVYNGGGTPIDFTSIPNQFEGISNTIVRSSVAPSTTTNRFDFGINNTSGNSQTVRYGWIQIS
jgi:hypothetical protein